jgi:hypothetical protein
MFEKMVSDLVHVWQSTDSNKIAMILKKLKACTKRHRSLEVLKLLCKCNGKICKVVKNLRKHPQAKIHEKARKVVSPSPLSILAGG